MKTLFKKITAKILYAGMLSVFCLTATTTARAQTYNPDVVQIIKYLIVYNGLQANIDAPETWEFATWNDESPKQITGINLSNKNLSGGASFVSNGGLSKLQTLNLDGNNLSGLYVAHCTELQQLSCQGCKLTWLGIYNCPELEQLNCSNNNLTEIDLSDLDKLTVFSGFGQNAFITFIENGAGEYIHNISLNNPRFGNSVISYFDGMLKSADITVYSTSFAVQTIGENYELSGTLNLDYKTVKSYDPLAVQRINDLIANNGLPATPNAPFAWDFATWNDETPKQLIAFNWQYGLRGDVSFAGLTTLQRIEVMRFNNISNLDITNCSQLEYLNCRGNKLTELDVTNFPQLEHLDCGENNLTEIDITNCKQLEYLGCGVNNLTEIDLTNCTQLEYLSCGGNNLTKIDLTNCTQLKTLSCGSNNLTALDITNCTQLQTLNCGENNLTELDATNCPQLQDLSCGYNDLTEINISNCTQLQILDCRVNALTNLDISNCTKLQILYFRYNNLSKLDVSNCPQLEILACDNNKLSELDLTGLENIVGSTWDDQHPLLTLVKNGTGGYTSSISLNNPTFENSAITYFDGILKSTNNTIAQTGFTVQTIGKDYQLSGTMHFTYSTTGINTPEKGWLKVYPNPTSGELTIENGKLAINKVEIVDMTGKSMPFNRFTSNNVSQISIRCLPAGIYFVKIETEQGVVTKKIIKQ